MGKAHISTGVNQIHRINVNKTQIITAHEGNGDTHSSHQSQCPPTMSRHYLTWVSAPAASPASQTRAAMRRWTIPSTFLDTTMIQFALISTTLPAEGPWY